MATEDLLDGRDCRVVCSRASWRAGPFTGRYDSWGEMGSTIGRAIYLSRLVTSVNSDSQVISRTDRFSRIGIGAYFDIRSWLRASAPTIA